MQQTPPGKPASGAEPGEPVSSGTGPAAGAVGDEDLSDEIPGPRGVVEVHRSPEDAWTLAVRLDLWNIRFEVNYQIHGPLVWAGALLTVLGLAVAAAVAVPEAIGVSSVGAAATAAAVSGGAILVIGTAVLIFGMRTRR